MTDVSRRSVIGAGAAAIAAGALGVGVPLAGAPGAAQAADPTYTSTSRLYTRSRWSKATGRWFTATAGGRSVNLQLIGVGDVAGARAGAADAFTLTFARRKAGPGQQTFQLSRRRFTPTSLFLVPDEDRRTYTAVVNTTR